MSCLECLLKATFCKNEATLKPALGYSSRKHSYTFMKLIGSFFSLESSGIKSDKHPAPGRNTWALLQFVCLYSPIRVQQRRLDLVVGFKRSASNLRPGFLYSYIWISSRRELMRSHEKREHSFTQKKTFITCFSPELTVTIQVPVYLPWGPLSHWCSETKSVKTHLHLSSNIQDQ